MINGAFISMDLLYRYTLSRSWAPLSIASARRALMFLMLNPSTADASVDDPTIRRCVGFAKSWGYTDLMVGNLYAYRATDPKALSQVGDPVGERNEHWLGEMIRDAHRVVCAWGDSTPKGEEPSRWKKRVARLIPDEKRLCFGFTKKGNPLHPLYLPARRTPSLWNVEPAQLGDTE
jgi:hypothetical protein